MNHRKISSLMDLILDVCRKTEVGEAAPADEIVDRYLAERGGELSVAKASVSRALRRMWRRGLVELYDSDGEDLVSLTDAIEVSRERLAEIESDPENFFHTENGAAGTEAQWNDVDSMLESYRLAYGGEFPSWFRARYVATVTD